MQKIKSILLYSSISRGNTSKIAKMIAREMKSDLMRTAEVSLPSLRKYNLIGFGSGIYGGVFHKKLIETIESMPEDFKGKHAFIFCTSIFCRDSYVEKFKELLQKKGFIVLGSYQSKGAYTNKIFKLFGGINKGRPNSYDFMDAADFAKDIMERYNEKNSDS
ncbi:MAG: flavodoxin domain-containing protein [bacterium]|nr:flavodoxin domain-containing protein [bacterium]